MGPYLTYIKGAAVIALLAGTALGLLALYHAGYHAGNIPMPTAHVLVSALGLGWMADSGLNKGGS